MKKTTTTTEADLASALMSARTMEDVEQILGMARDLYGDPQWRHVGDRANNIGTVRLGSDPALGVVERTINGMDAMLDLGHALHPADAPTSPVEAAQLWYGVPRGGLAEMDDDPRRALGEKIRVWLEESGEPKKPTVVWADDGIGQSPEEFPKTLLSLNENNKVGQHWNMGTYGQGGAVTFGFSRATIIISRRHPDHRGEHKDSVGWTIVKEVETDPSRMVLPTWMYVVGKDREVLRLPPSLFPGLAHGSQFTAIAYDLQGWTGPFTTGLWQFLHAAIFEPVLPFLVTGKRAKERTYGTRIVIGNAARLNRPEKARGDLEVTYADSTTFDLGARHGKIVFDYWVVQRPEGSTTASEPAAGYVRAENAVSMTLFGQRQDAESRTWIRTNALLPFLYKNMIVRIQANGLTPIARRELFATTRERATKSELKDTIYGRLAAVLREDEELKRLNYVERERLLKRSTAASSEKVRKRLAKFITTRLKDRFRAGRSGRDKGSGGTRRKSPGGVGPGRDISDSHLHNVPTKLAIKRKVMPLQQGGTCWTWVEIDAKNGYLPAHSDDLTVDIEGGDGKVRLSMRSQLLGGLTRWTFEADPDAPLGEASIAATLVTPAGILTDSAKILVRKAEEARPRRLGSEPETGPEVRWVFKEEWDEHDGMNERTVGYVTEDQDTTIIWVNRNHRLLDKALGRRSLTPEQVETRADRYQFPVAAALWLQHDAVKSTDPQPSDAYQSAELERLAEAVLLAADPDVDAALETSEE